MEFEIVSGRSAAKEERNLNHEGRRSDRQDASAPRRQNELGLQERRIDQRQRHHVAGRHRRFAGLAELKADAAVHAGEGFHGFH